MPKTQVELIPDATERRSTKRFPIERAMRYSLVTETGLPQEWLSAWTTDISSGGILFAPAPALYVGARLQIEIDWPVLLNERISLKLVIFGRVARCEDGVAAAAIDRYQFRTRAAGSSPIPIEPCRMLRYQNPNKPKQASGIGQSVEVASI